MSIVRRLAERAESALDQLIARAHYPTFESLLVSMIPDAKHPVRRQGRQVFAALCNEYREQGPLGLRALAQDLSALPASFPVNRSAAGAAIKRHHGLKVLYVCGMFPSINHGGGLRLFDILRGLGERLQIDLYSSFYEHLDRKSLDLLLPYLGATRLVPNHELVTDDVLAWLHRRGIKPNSYDAIHFEFPYAFVNMQALCRYGRKSLFTMMECATRASLIDLERHVEKEPKRVGRFARNLVLRHRLEREAFAACDLGIAVTEADAEFARATFGVPLPPVIPTCVSEYAVGARSETDQTALDAQIVPGTVTFVGYFDHYPNVDAMKWYLEQVHPVVRTRVPGYQLRIVGRGDTSSLTRSFGDQPSVVFVGPVEELAEELSRADVCVVPIFSGAGIRGKINQYTAFGRPTVSSSLGVSGMAYRHRESILIADAPAAFADAVCELLVDRTLWKRIQGQSQMVLEAHYRWPATLRKLEALYES